MDRSQETLETAIVRINFNGFHVAGLRNYQLLSMDIFQIYVNIPNIGIIPTQILEYFHFFASLSGYATGQAG